MTAQGIRFLFNKQRGSSTVIRTWEEFDAAQQARILEGVQLDPGEFPIIGSADERTCLTITQKRILWRLDSTPYSLDLDRIVRVKVPEFFESSKHDLRRLWIVTSDGTEHPVEVESGEPFFVLWNLLLQMVGQPRSVVGQ